jgi:RNA polymerase sigma factor (sigma-70 family)
MIEELVRRAKDGDRKAEEEIFRHLFERFRLFVTRRFGSEEAEDIASEACSIVVRKYRSVSYTEGFEAWSYGVLKNVIRNWLRKKKTHDRVVTGQSDQETENPSGSGHDHELNILFLDCLRKMLRAHHRYARVLNLIHHGFRADEISEKLHIKTNNLYVLLNRSRNVLRHCLETGTVE